MATNSTHPTITIDLILDRLTTKDALRGVLHAILFHRLFGLVKPQPIEVLDVTMCAGGKPGVVNPETEALVDERVDAFWRGVEGGPGKRGQITVTFSEKRPRKSWFPYMGEEDVAWEQWVINAEVRQPKTDRERQAANAALAGALTQAVQTMLVHTSSERGRAAVPLITNAVGISPFPVRIAVFVGGVEVGAA